MTIVIFLYKDGLSCYNSRIYGHQTTGKEYLMAKTADTIAIYSRKSRYTGKGESIGNQIDLFLQAENDSEPSFPVHIV